MNQLKLLAFFSSLLFLVACGNESSDTSANQNDENASKSSETKQENTEDEESNISKKYDLNSILHDTGIETEERWIQEDGKLAANKEFVVSESIEYDPNNTYNIQLSSYVSYFKDDVFIKTNRHSADEDREIESVDVANQIKISYRPDALE